MMPLQSLLIYYSVVLYLGFTKIHFCVFCKEYLFKLDIIKRLRKFRTLEVDVKNNEVLFVPLPGNSKLEQRIAALNKLADYIKFSDFISPKDKVAVKVHVGEVDNTTHISADLMLPVVKKVKAEEAYPFLTETSTLYPGPRSNAIGHLNLAYKHGFTPERTGAPFIMADGLMGNNEVKVEIPGKLYKSVNIAKDAVLADAFVIFSHPTGHIVSGLGACLKNLGMGLSTRKGKLKQHSSVKPSIVTDKCTFCQECMKWCPEDCIIEKDGKAYIESEKCIGCGECISVCKFGAVKFNYAIESVEIQKRIAEYAMGSVMNKRDKCLFINVLTDMTTECDCMGGNQKPVVPDVGILASYDPVAIDRATLDLTRKMNGKDLGEISKPNLNPFIQLEHAELIGLGSQKYILKEV